MANTIAFKSWLLEPGNHRQLRDLRNTLQAALKKKIEIASWPDLYRVFEESVEVEDTHREVFEPVFDEYPPSEESGATPRQILLYRGAQYDPDALPEARAETITVTYRGQVIEKSRAPSEPSAQEPDAATKAEKPRYYRGARIN